MTGRPAGNDRGGARLFAGWREIMVLSCLQGHMGTLTVNRDATAGAIAIGDFCFLAGVPDEVLVRAAAPPILVPRTRDWDGRIEAVYGARVRVHTRYATEKEPGHLDPRRLRELVRVPEGFALAPIDAGLYDRLSLQRWSRDLRGLFDGAEDFGRRGLGFVALHRGAVAAGASAYAVCDGGMELQVDTAPELRRRGLAAACAARMILACLERGIYPSWDAHTRASLALAEKLGYRSAGPYRTYIKVSFREEGTAG